MIYYEARKVTEILLNPRSNYSDVCYVFLEDNSSMKHQSTLSLDKTFEFPVSCQADLSSKCTTL